MHATASSIKFTLSQSATITNTRLIDLHGVLIFFFKGQESSRGPGCKVDFRRPAQ